ncbi:MAG TPA: VOC family protein, partial [Acidimicrobiales bacterium]
FFEYEHAELEPFAKPAGIPDPRAIQFDHLSFNLADEHALESLQARLKEHGCEVTDVVDHGSMHSIYFTDPNGIALEASWWVKDATEGDPDYGDRALFADHDPVPAVRELQDRGDLGSVPHTRLTHEPTDIADPA